MNPGNVLLLPGWQNSGPDHWQSRWEALHGFVRVQQHDWMRPLRGDWCARLDDVVQDSAEPVWLVAHSLGCQLVAAWAAVSRHTARVRAALLVAAPDTERTDVRELLPSWAPIPMQALPMPATQVISDDDPYCTAARALAMAQAWGTRVQRLGACGHINADSGLGDWAAGIEMLQKLEQLTMPTHAGESRHGH